MKSLFLGLLAPIVLSGCASVTLEQGQTQVFRAPRGSLEEAVDRAGGTLSVKDKNMVVAGIKTIHEDGSIPDSWKTESGAIVSIQNKGFHEVGNAVCVNANITLDSKTFIPWTEYCATNGEWSVASVKTQTAPAMVEIAKPLPPVASAIVAPPAPEERVANIIPPPQQTQTIETPEYEAVVKTVPRSRVSLQKQTVRKVWSYKTVITEIR